MAIDGQQNNQQEIEPGSDVIEMSYAACDAAEEDYVPEVSEEDAEEDPDRPFFMQDPDNPDEIPSDFYGWLMRAYYKIRIGDRPGAWEAALKALEMGTDEPDLYVPLCQQFPPKLRRKLADMAMQKTAPDHDAFQWLWVEVAMSFWYEGNYKEACAEYETILKQKRLDPGLTGILLTSWAMTLEAMGEYKLAEQKYLEAGNQEAMVRARARSGDVQGALALMDEGYGPPNQKVFDSLYATWQCLLGIKVKDLKKRIKVLRTLDNDWIYKHFMMGVMSVAAKKEEQGVEHLTYFLDVCSRNHKEWGVTLRWEIDLAEQIVSNLVGEVEEEMTEEEEGAQAAETEEQAGADAPPVESPAESSEAPDAVPQSSGEEGANNAVEEEVVASEAAETSEAAAQK